MIQEGISRTEVEYPHSLIDIVMNRILGIAAFLAVVLLASCGENKQNHPYEGTFTASGIMFVLNPDSTTRIIFNDSVSYEGRWTPTRADDGLEFANIEFGGYQKYYYLKDGKLYRSEREMRHDVMGVEVRYMK